MRLLLLAFLSIMLFGCQEAQQQVQDASSTVIEGVTENVQDITVSVVDSATNVVNDLLQTDSTKVDSNSQGTIEQGVEKVKDFFRNKENVAEKSSIVATASGSVLRNKVHSDFVRVGQTSDGKNFLYQRANLQKDDDSFWFGSSEYDCMQIDYDAAQSLGVEFYNGVFY